MSGKRYIDSFPSATDFPVDAPDGAQAFAEDEQVMYFRANNAWQAFSGGDSIFNTLTYDTVKATDVLDIQDVWTPIATLTTPSRPAGKYVVGMSFTYSFPDTNDYAEARFRVDGGVWNDFRSEPKDIQDRIANFYEYPSDFAAGVHTIEFEMKKSTITANQLDLLFLDLMFQRVG